MIMLSLGTDLITNKNVLKGIFLTLYVRDPAGLRANNDIVVYNMYLCNKYLWRLFIICLSPQALLEFWSYGKDMFSLSKEKTSLTQLNGSNTAQL